MQFPQVSHINELFALALALEQESARRYRELARQMAAHGQAELQALFDRLAEHEEHHYRQVRDWAETEQISIGRPVAPPRWEVPLPGVEYDDEAADVHQSTPYKALALAVHNEQRAYSLYCHIAANSDDAEVRGHAETLAREELSHAAILRAKRREAFHQGRRDSGALSRWPMQASFDSVDEMFAIARQIESRIAVSLAAARQDASAADALAHTLAILDELGGRLADPDPPQTTRALEAALADSERAYAFYDLVLTRAGEDPVRAAAQTLAEAALDRLRILYS